jgi:hypothetical protein
MGFNLLCDHSSRDGLPPPFLMAAGAPKQPPDPLSTTAPLHRSPQWEWPCCCCAAGQATIMLAA